MNRRLHLPVVLSLALLGIASQACAQDQGLPLADYRTENWYLPQTPSVTAGPAAGFWNPAAFAATDRAGADFWWNDRNVRSGLDNYGLALGRTLNFAMQTNTWGTSAESWKTYDYQLGTATGTRRAMAGLAYRWTRGETGRTPRQQALLLGAITRPGYGVSFGAASALSLESSAAQYLFDLGIRPLGRHWLTLFADYAVNHHQAFFSDGYWGAGFEVRPVRGLHLGLRGRKRVADDDVEWQASIGVTLNTANVTVMPWLDKHGNSLNNAFLLRAGTSASGLSPDQVTIPGHGNTWTAVNLEHRVLNYQKYRYFDDRNVAWLDLLAHLDAIESDASLRGVAVNIAGLSGRPSLFWELHEKLQAIRAAGKEVVVHGDAFGPLHCLVAAAADRVTIDPQGQIFLPGFALARSYLKGTLEKLGVGFQDFRYFTYKSATETLSRSDMSAPDRKQRQRIVDVLYETVAAGVSEGRGLALDDFDAAVDERVMILPAEAVELGFVDATARWDDIPEWLAAERHARFTPRPPGHGGKRFWSDQWGEPARIPVVYAVGPCAMDEGIKGRETSRYLRSLVHDDRVKAVVLRADSPGGFPLPSDLVADAVRRLRAAGKPVIVSQGDVAASGGYWISMDGTRILTTPVTITGSIGVIGGWVWNDGLADKLGVTSDAVSRGRHADLFTTVRLPILGPLPRRPLDDDELARVESVIRTHYDTFVAAVAAGRGLDEAHVREVAEGRVWMGNDAIAQGLCDGIGTLSDAIAMARDLSGLPAWQEVDIVEYPPRPLFPWPRLLPRMPSFLPFSARVNGWLASSFVNEPGAPETPPLPAGWEQLELEFIKAIAAHNGQAVLMTDPDLLPPEWRRLD